MVTFLWVTIFEVIMIMESMKAIVTTWQSRRLHTRKNESLSDSPLFIQEYWLTTYHALGTVPCSRDRSPKARDRPSFSGLAARSDSVQRQVGRSVGLWGVSFKV